MMGFEEDADDARFEEAFERAALARIGREIGPILRDHGIGAVDRRPAHAEQQRVRGIIARDQADRHRDDMRRMAQQQVANGSFENIEDTVVEPTPEWLGKGPVRGFTAKLRDEQVQNVKTVRSVRRVLTPVIEKLYHADKITSTQFAACKWYRTKYELAGLEGHYATTRFSDEPRRSDAPDYMTESQAEARGMIRGAQAALTDKYRAFFEKVVVGDVPLRRAAGAARCPYRRAGHHFGIAATLVADFCERCGVDLAKAMD